VKFYIEMLRAFVEFRVARESDSGLVVSHNVSDRRPIQLRFSQKGAEPLEMQNGIVLSDVFGISYRRGHFPLSLR
jgi:hypothetical protein